jgi:hypothetical protein
MMAEKPEQQGFAGAKFWVIHAVAGQKFGRGGVGLGA